jgi:hypothetical protein
MPKSNPLSKALAEKKAKAKAAGAAPAPASNGNGEKSKRVMIGTHFSPQVQMEMKVICAQERITMQALLAEAINCVLAKRGRPEIAGVPVEE